MVFWVARGWSRIHRSAFLADEGLWKLTLGASKAIKTDGGNVAQTGLVAKNILSKQMMTILGSGAGIAP
jgi:hypothetical protein